MARDRRGMSLPRCISTYVCLVVLYDLRGILMPALGRFTDAMLQQSSAHGANRAKGRGALLRIWDALSKESDGMGNPFLYY
jgi:hypothetical protein